MMLGQQFEIKSFHMQFHGSLGKLLRTIMLTWKMMRMKMMMKRKKRSKKRRMKKMMRMKRRKKKIPSPKRSQLLPARVEEHLLEMVSLVRGHQSANTCSFLLRLVQCDSVLKS